MEWKTLYISGRMQKPIAIVKDESGWRQLNQVNLMHAIKVAMLLLPEEFDEWQLFTTLSRLSYMGDLRVGIAENPQKIHNIVNRQIAAFREHYGDVLYSMQYLDRLSNDRFRQDISIDARNHLIASLPRQLSLQLNKLNCYATSDYSQMAKLIKHGMS